MGDSIPHSLNRLEVQSHKEAKYRLAVTCFEVEVTKKLNPYHFADRPAVTIKIRGGSHKEANSLG
jgi:hypothetical protein